METGLIESTRAALQAHAPELVAAYVFGSVARGTATERSDLDLGLLFRREPELGLSGMGFDTAHDLELKLKRRVDVVVLNRASPDLVHRVLRDGVLVLEPDPRARVAFEVYARGQFFDLAPLRRLYRQGASSGGTTWDLELAAKKLSEIETFVGELRSLGRPELVTVDLRERRFVEHTLQLAIQAALDLASHIVSDERWGEPETYAELFSTLATRGFIPELLAPRLRRMAGFRNLLVHGYTNVKPEIVSGIASRDVQDLLDFAAAVRQSLKLAPPSGE